MTVTHTITRSWSKVGALPLNYTTPVSSDSEINYSDTIEDGTVDKQIKVPIDVSELKALFIGSDQAVTLEANSPGGVSGVASDTLSVSADQAVDWMVGDVADCPLSEDVTYFYVTNTSGEDAALEIRGLTGAGASASSTAPRSCLCVSDYGALCDGSTDDTTAVQAAIAALGHGDALFFPGFCRVTDTLDMPALRGSRFFGCSSKAIPTSPGSETASSIGSGIYGDVDGPLLRFTTSDAMRGFRMEHMTLWRPDDSQGESVAVQWLYDDAFVRDFWFNDVDIRGYSKAFEITTGEVYPTTAKQVVGNLQITHCNIQNNNRLLICSDRTRINHFIFENNDAGQNGYNSGGGIKARVTVARVVGNILEGQRDALHLCDTSGCFTIADNTLDGNVGDFGIMVEDSSSFKIGYDRMNAHEATYYTLAKDCEAGHIWGTSTLDNCTNVEQYT